MSNRRPDQFLQERRHLDHEHVSITATGETKLLKATRKWRLDSARYVNPTGLAADAVNYYTIELLKNGSTVMASWSTQDTGEGALAADTYVDLVLAAPGSDLVLDADDELSLKFTESGTQTLPPGRVQIEGRYL